MLTGIERVIDKICSVLIFVVGAAVILMMASLTADVTGKYLFNQPIHGTSEIVGYYLMIAIVFLSLPIVEHYNKSIYVEIFYNLMPRAAKIACLGLVYVLQVAFFGVLAKQSFQDAIEATLKRDVVEGIVRIDVWPARYMLLIGFVLAAVVSLLRLLQVVTMHPCINSLLFEDGPPHSEEAV